MKGKEIAKISILSPLRLPFGAFAFNVKNSMHPASSDQTVFPHAKFYSRSHATIIRVFDEIPVQRSPERCRTIREWKRKNVVDEERPSSPSAPLKQRHVRCPECD
jgi:hypothetical protein